VPRWLSDLIELAVGVACLAGGWFCWSHRGVTFRMVAVVLVVAGLAASANVVASLVLD
jgi:hypothetical protein